MAAQKGSAFGPNYGNWASTLGQRPSKFTPTLGQSACIADFSFTRRGKHRAVNNFNGRCIWLFYKNNIRDVGSTADLVLVLLVHLVHWYLVHLYPLVPNST